MNSRFSSERRPALLFSFDPNTTTKADLIKLGLPEKTAATILKFREKGGVFHKKEDLQKIYGLKSKDYERLASYVQLENKAPVTNQKPIAAQAAQSPDFQKPTSTHNPCAVLVRLSPNALPTFGINSADLAILTR